MARVTRSKKVDIAEDNTTLTLADQTPLPDTVSRDQQPLVEIEGNTMPDEVATQLKGLKAAYRMAIGATGGGKKGKKGRSKNKANVQEEEIGQLIEVDENAIECPVSGDDGQRQSSQENISLNQVHSMEHPLAAPTITEEYNPIIAEPAGRTTRRQLAKAQAGQSNGSFGSLPDRRIGSAHVKREKDLDFLTSLFTGRPARPSRDLGGLTSGIRKESGYTTNDYLFLAEEAIRKAAAQGVNKESTNIEAPATAVSLQTALTFSQMESIGDSNTQTRAEPPKPTSIEKGTMDIRTPQSPAKSARKTLEEVEKTYNLAKATAPSDDEDEDSFVELITSRSPAKPVSRIEDSLEALDQMDEVIEALDEAAMAERMISSEKTRQRSQEKSIKAPSKAPRAQAATKQQPEKPGYASLRVKPSAPKRSLIIKKATSMTFKQSGTNETGNLRHVEGYNEPAAVTRKAPLKRPISLLPPKETVKSTKPATRPTNFELPGEAVAKKLKEQREARLAQRESSEDSFQTTRSVSGFKVKSSKPLTKPSSFELPGEALSRKKREAHEARLKAQEEEERKRREFKAKPVRKSVVPNMVPRDTVASRARQSKIGAEIIEDGNLTIHKRLSGVGAHRPSILELSKANTSAPRAPGPPAPLERKPSTKFHGPSMSGMAMQRTVSASDVQVQRQRAKEIYNRDNKLTEEIEREKREREAAAKHSREEAAERGRQASREWAEKQRARKVAEGDKGMSAGYGPGGQMGLKA